MARFARFAVLTLILMVMAPTVAVAHPLGNFTVNRYSRLEPSGDRVQIIYVLDMAEIPTFQEQARIDGDRNGSLDAAELEAYATTRAEELGRGLRVELDGVPTLARLVSRSLNFPPGQGGLLTMRLEAVFRADVPGDAGGPIALRYRDENDPSRIGWHEVVARPGSAGTEIRQASVPAQDQTDELRTYPDDLLNSPLGVREARLTFVPGAVSTSPAQPGGFVGLAGTLGRPKDAYADLVAAGELTPSTILFSLLAALVLGAFHALSPGHGKTVVAAYLVGARGTARHAVFLGATVTATHTIGVYALGFVTLYLSQYILPERLYPVLQVVSGLLVVGIGAWLFATRLRGALVVRRAGQFGHAHDHDDAHGHGHAHDHGHDHDHDPTHGHGHEHIHRQDQAHAHHHDHPHADARPHGHSHGPAQDEHADHGHVHHRAGSHQHADRDHGPHERHEHAAGEPVHSHGELVHSHGGRAHSHLPPGADGQPVTWRSLLALGVSGGLVPCPSALVVLLSAIALHRVAFGLLLIVAFSLGLAAVLVGIGLLLVYARHLFQRVSIGGRFAPRLVPVASALLIVATGVALVLQALPLS